MKIVTYNVNGLRQRISQFGSLQKLLDSFDADIICFQETKLRRQELSSDLVMADGYESFISCTRTNDKGRTGYSGVATFCRVKSAFSSCEVALPIAAEEGFTGVLENSRAEGFYDFSREELLKVDSEGRCIVTDHGHFVLFNVYGPRADSDDADRIQFKSTFFKILQRRWESLLQRKRRIFVVGDINIAPYAIDRCDAGPDFETNEFRRWLRSMLVESGGQFYDVFRRKHPDREDAYTCWSSSTGAEQFNYGSRIDHILCAGSCLHLDHEVEGHNLLACHVNECDILTEYKRWKGGNVVRWKGGLSIKLEGSDHVPVYTSLEKIPDILQHNAPPVASRYLPMIFGQQQTLVAVLMKRQAAQQAESQKVKYLSESTVEETSSNTVKKPLSDCSAPSNSIESCPSSQECQADSVELTERTMSSTDKCVCSASRILADEQISGAHVKETKRKARKTQLSLTSFFQKSPKLKDDVHGPSTDFSINKSALEDTEHQTLDAPILDDHSGNVEQYQLNSALSSQDLDVPDSCPQKEKNVVALLEWQRIQQIMQQSIPLCKGHKEPCVSRIVKKPGPTFGHRFYVCARAEGPASNPEANCGFFRWASMKSQKK